MRVGITVAPPERQGCFTSSIVLKRVSMWSSRFMIDDSANCTPPPQCEEHGVPSKSGGGNVSVCVAVGSHLDPAFRRTRVLLNVHLRQPLCRTNAPATQNLCRLIQRRAAAAASHNAFDEDFRIRSNIVLPHRKNHGTPSGSAATLWCTTPCELRLDRLTPIDRYKTVSTASTVSTD